MGLMPPEKKQTFDKKAKLYLSDLVFVKEVEIQPQDKDRYGRTVGLVYVGQRSVNEEMVKAGFAWVYRQYCMPPDCAGWLKLEHQAKSIGIDRCRIPSLRHVSTIRLGRSPG
jgi:endonuclease YncB( thermonuclease family)